ncbi:MAG: T9SS type A sorting domain-containing protein [Bacteroidia bacterium]|nr:T9SS type A sorting domain-containing protein [Bacteroidia bacterium]
MDSKSGKRNIFITFTDWDNYVKCEVRNSSGIIVETLQRTQNDINGFGQCFSYSLSRLKKEIEPKAPQISILHNAIKIYPNPTEGKVTIDIISETNDVVTLNIYELNNRVVYTQKNIALTSGLATLNLNLDLQSGLYTLKIQGQTTNYIEKLIIQ